MLDVLTNERVNGHAAILDSMFRLRYEVFVKRLGWPLNCPFGMEEDQFDHEGAVYLALRNRDNEVVASARLLPMSGSNLLKDVFPFLIEDREIPSGPDVWEVTRVAVDHRKERTSTVPGCTNVAGTLFCGIFEFATRLGLTHLVSVSDPRMERILRRAGWNIQRLGRVHTVDGFEAVGEISEVSREALMTMRRTNGINGSVLKEPINLPSTWDTRERRAA